MALNVYLIKSNKRINITTIISEISWESSMDTLGQQLSFNAVYGVSKDFPKNPIDIGDMIVFSIEKEVFRGIIVNENKSTIGTISYVAFDFAFYLNKSKKFYQFNKMKADAAIKKIASDYGTKIGKVTSMPTVINEVFMSETGADIIKKIIEQSENDQGIKYRMEFRQGKLYVDKQKDLTVRGKFRLSVDFAYKDAKESVFNVSRTRSIEEMVNSVQIVMNNKVVYTHSDSKLIKKYGLLQDVIDVQDKNSAQVKNEAKNILSELGKVLETATCEMLGDERVIAGRTIELKDDISGLSGKYLINSVSHSIINDIHKMSLDLLKG